MSRDNLLLGLLGMLNQPTKPRVFVSYHHENDQWWYNRFSQLFSGTYDILTDRSLERELDSDDVDYQQQRIRDENITGTSVTVVLCGSETWKRRWIDWEIQMTLNKEHGLLGIALPTHAKNINGNVIVPDRLYANVQSGFAHWIHWNEDPQVVRAAIVLARSMAGATFRIANSEPRMQRSRS